MKHAQSVGALTMFRGRQFGTLMPGGELLLHVYEHFSQYLRYVAAGGMMKA